MPFPIVEYCRAPPADGFRANPHDPALIKPSTDVVKGTEGVLRVYYGLQRDKVHMNLVVAWEAFEYHDRLKATPGYAQLCQDFLLMVAALDFSPVHVQANAEPYGALDAPVTEVVTVTTEPEHRARVEELMGEFEKTLSALDEAAGVISLFWGPTVDKENTFLLFIGWRDHDASGKVIRSNAALAELIAQCKKIAKMDIAHVELTAH